MATNRELEDGDQFTIDVSSATGPNDPVESGDPLLIGDLPAVALTDEDDDEATVQCNGVFRLEVDPSSGMNPGAEVFIQSDGSLDDDNTGDHFGYTLDDVSSAGDTVRVKVGH